MLKTCGGNLLLYACYKNESRLTKTEKTLDEDSLCLGRAGSLGKVLGSAFGCCGTGAIS